MSTPKNVFDHANHILKYQNTEYYSMLSDSDKNTFSTYMINKIISYVDKFNYILIPAISDIDELIFKSKLSPDMAYLLYIGTIPKSNMYNIKYQKSSSEDSKYTQDLINIISKHLEISKDTTIAYLNQYFKNNSGKQYLEHVLESYGYDTKDIKKIMTVKK